jgi:hypothetical protein
VDEPWQSLLRLWWDLVALATWLSGFLLRWSLLILAMAWCLWAVNWRKLLSVLAQGAWVPGILALVTSALIWSRISPGVGNFFGLFDVGNFWWQLGDLCLVAAAVLCCGWIQGALDWTPPEVSVEPADAPAHGTDHGHH